MGIIGEIFDGYCYGGVQSIIQWNLCEEKCNENQNE